MGRRVEAICQIENGEPEEFFGAQIIWVFPLFTIRSPIFYCFAVFTLASKKKVDIAQGYITGSDWGSSIATLESEVH